MQDEGPAGLFLVYSICHTGPFPGEISATAGNTVCRPATASCSGFPAGLQHWLEACKLAAVREDAIVIVKLACCPLQTHFGIFTEHLYYDGLTEVIALVFGDVSGKPNVPVRIHSACLTAHAFFSTECDCREQMAMAQAHIVKEGFGVVVWLNQEGKGNGHFALVVTSADRRNNIGQADAYVNRGFAADRRDYAAAGKVLRDLNPASIVLLTNNPKKLEALSVFVPISGNVQLVVDPENNPILSLTLADKRRQGHRL